MFAVVYGIIAACLAVSVLSVCPHEDRSLGLKRWSSQRTWRSGKPTRYEPVVISSPVLLDIQPPELHSINITSTGRLVWSPGTNITLRLKFIYILGRLDIGSEDCPFTDPARIVLTGRRGEFQFTDHLDMLIGDKVIVVGEGGTIEIHGQKKLSWTKLTQTLPKLTAGNGILFDHQKSGNLEKEKYENGLVAYVFNIDSNNHVSVRHSGSYEVISTWQEHHERRRMVKLLENLMHGDILAMGIHYKVDVDQRNISVICDALETAVYGYVTRTSKLRHVRKFDAYTAIVHKIADGHSTIIEDLSTFFKDGDVMDSVSVLLSPETDVKISAESHVDQKRSWMSYVNFRISTRDGAFPKLNLLDDVTTWRPGDRVVITSTDYDWRQAEEATVVLCSDCTSKQIRVDLEAKYEHFGEIVSNVDMRAEVALLSRNIRIEGEVETHCVHSNGNCHVETADTFGGQTKFLSGSTVHIEGVELYHMGQQTDVGRYPLHFHMGLGTLNVTSSPYVRGNSIHHSFSRCVTVHATHGVTVQDNVCYMTRGHAFFVEDGSELDTLFDGNLAASVEKGSLLPSDIRPSCFWITSPRTRLRNNVAAGGEAIGIWYIFPVKPIGPSESLGIFKPHEADRTPITEFDNNVAHSNLECGLLLDSRLQPDGDATGINSYEPKENPLDSKSPDKEVTIRKLTAYKNRYMNAWVRGGNIRITQASLSDSAKAITMARSVNPVLSMTDSVVIGLSRNKGEPCFNLSYSLPVWFDKNSPIQGFTFYDGPVWGENIWFDGFVSTELYKAGAISYERGNEFSSSAVSGIRNAKFGFTDGPLTGNRVYDGDEGISGFSRMDGDKAATSRDYDGSVTGLKMGHIVKPWPFYTSDKCTYRENWNMAVCPHTYGKLRVDVPRLDKNNTFPVMVRDDIPTVNETMTGINSADFLTILGGAITYTLHWTEYIPETFTVYGDGLEKGLNVRFGVCLPVGATFELFSHYPKYLPRLYLWKPANSIHDLDTTFDGSKYFHDRNTGMLYFNFVSNNGRHRNDTKSCPGGECPMVTIKNIHGNRYDADCRSRLYHTTQSTDNRIINLRRNTRRYGKTTIHPPQTWGVGATKPFINRIPVNGGWGMWSQWGSCSKTCGGGRQIRIRACDSPLPVNGGKECSGSLNESRICKTNHCPVDGAFSHWSNWSSCMKSTGCQGYKKRSRSCSKPQPTFGGTYCRGADEEVEPCIFC